MSHQLLEKVSTHLRMAGLLDDVLSKYYGWKDADLQGKADFVVFLMSGTSGPRDAIVQSPDIKLLVVGQAVAPKATNEKADAIFENLAGLTTPEGIIKLEPLSIVSGPYYLDNGRCVFEINLRCFVSNTQMALFDAQSFSFTFNGALVGGTTKFSVVDGVTPDVVHTPLGANERFYFPGVPEFGNINLVMYRDFTDPGQIAMEAARASSLRIPCILRFSDGTAIQFAGYVKKLPIVGDNKGLGTADAVIKIAGKVIAA